VDAKGTLGLKGLCGFDEKAYAGFSNNPQETPEMNPDERSSIQKPDLTRQVI
jgi:hypothetical protein